ncbi:drug resistance transporter, EmrB/QacA subfamily protein (plasmid) [Scytonema sp. HK-05]|uniref:DHA2 family efflux MFS transporter permease subunit n=1 Tax=Scytonema sp. HK-05 TaxID=1137095 RepID=UPI0009371F33|nr:DHA2 family efflux MFS transporter permease subunit [Scytonema sp. HK-05]OKH59411.1 EmrB/QacA family drug resistance transporter [Scytonema sp. HK-05]BAY50080.1 drug resistance transporter, EmrB/QacA subfamily protein [Scytonema sp. HK-05]
MTNPSATNQTVHKPVQDVSFKDWVGVSATLLGAFMAVLDIQITNASLNDITGALGASLDEGAWISTAYLVAEIVVIPLTGWLAQVFSVRRYLLYNAALFICFSVACAFATNLPMMMLFRAGQGFTGGVLIPMAFTVILMTLPPPKQPVGMALFGLSATLAPSLGPTVGGWLTDSYSWQYIFYLNVLPGLMLLAGVWYALPQRSMQLELLKKGDWLGIAMMAIGLASLEFFLEEGNRKDWLGSEEIQHAAILAGITLPIFVIIQFIKKQPLLNLRLLGRRNFLISILTTTGLGMGLYGSTFILPLYLAQIQGYNAMQIGETIMWAGMPQLFITPFVPKLMKRFDLRLLVAVGFTLFGVSCFMNTTMSQNTGYLQLIPAQIVRAFGQPLVMTPLSSFATAGIEPKQIGSASAIYNMARNLGGSIGIATLGTLQSVRERFHSNRLVDAISLSNPMTRDRIDQMTQMFLQHTNDATQAQNQAYALIDKMVRREANIMAFNDCFFFMGCVLFLSAFLVLFFQKVKPGAGGAAH